MLQKKGEKKIMKLTKGYRGAHSKLFRTANQQYMKSLKYSYKDRKDKKRLFRKLWIMRINATVRKYGTKYNIFTSKIKQVRSGLNRKIIAQLGILDIITILRIIRLVLNAK